MHRRIREHSSTNVPLHQSYHWGRRYCYTAREITMITLINEFTDMPDWHRKIFDPDLVFEWKSGKLLIGRDITRSMIDWVCWETI